MTGITRSRAAEVVAQYFGTIKEYQGGVYDAYTVPDTRLREWKVMSDASIDCQRKNCGRRVSADRSYSVELVSPICYYDDIPTVQELVRKLRAADAFINPSCSVHIHENHERQRGMGRRWRDYPVGAILHVWRQSSFAASL